MKSQSTSSASEPIETLRQLGLSKSAATCYWLLVRKLPKAMSVSHITKETSLSTASLYRALHELEIKGFVETILLAAPQSFRAIPLSEALDNYALHQRQLAQPLIKILHSR